MNVETFFKIILDIAEQRNTERPEKIKLLILRNENRI